MKNGFRPLNQSSHSDEDDEAMGEFGESDMPVSMTPSSTRTSCCGAFRESLQAIQKNWRVLLFGQALSFLLAAKSAAQATVEFECEISAAPTLRLVPFYAMLMVVALPLLYQQRRAYAHYSQPPRNLSERSHENLLGESATPPPSAVAKSADSTFFKIFPLHTSNLFYLLLAFLDVNANYFTVLALRYTTITSVNLLDALAIPSAMVLSRFYLGRYYSRGHVIGVLCCMVGVLLNVFQDYESDGGDEESDFPHQTRGDFFAMVAGMLFGINATLIEFVVRGPSGTLEFTAMLGTYATFVSVMQVLILERHEGYRLLHYVLKTPQRYVVSNSDHHDEHMTDLKSSCSPHNVMLLLIAFNVFSFIHYVGSAKFLQISEAVFLNLSLLTGDLWTVAFSVLAEHIIPRLLFYPALVFIVAGNVVYEMTPSPIHLTTGTDHTEADDVDDDDDDDDLVDDEMEESGFPKFNGTSSAFRTSELELLPRRTNASSAAAGTGSNGSINLSPHASFSDFAGSI